MVELKVTTKIIQKNFSFLHPNDANYFHLSIFYTSEKALKEKMNQDTNPSHSCISYANVCKILYIYIIPLIH